MKLKNPQGREFWLTFMRNHNDPPPESQTGQITLELFVTSDYDCDVTVEIKALGFRERVTLKANTVEKISIDRKAQITTSEVVEKDMAVHVLSDNPVTVYGLNRRKQTTDTFLGLPIEVIGNSYRAICYSVSEELMSEFAIVAAENDTKLTIIPSANTDGGMLRANSYNITLQKGDVYQVAARNEGRNIQSDLTGTIVTANKNFSFFSGHQCAYVPEKIIACNHLVEQLPPVPSWGRNYYVGNLKGRTKSTYRVMADKDGTRVFEDSKFVAELQAGEFYEKEHRNPLQITANKPILVSQYSQGFRNGDAIGDPMMIIVSPTQQFLEKYRFATPVSGSWEHYVNVVIPTDAINSLRLNGQKVNKRVFKQIGLSRYSIGYIRINFGTHELTANDKFGMVSYGFGFDKDQYDAYGTLGGQSFVEYTEFRDILPPEIKMLTDNNGDPSSLVVRDDRENDFGIESIDAVFEEGLEFKVPSFDKGAPQASIPIPDVSSGNPAKGIIEVTDVAGNSKIYTLCYSMNPNTGSFEYNLSQGEQDCESTKGWSFSAGFAYGLSFNSGGFRTIPTYSVPAGGTEFEGGTNQVAGFKIGIAKSVTEKVKIGLNVGFYGVEDELTAYGIPAGRYFDPSIGFPQNLFQNANLSFDGTAVSLDVFGEFSIFRNTRFRVGPGIEILPEAIGFTEYSTPPNGLNQEELDDFLATGRNNILIGAAGEESETINRIIPFLNASLVYRIPISRRVSVLPEIGYRYTFLSPIADSDWSYSRLLFALSASYNI
ncbi:MAG: hypothetical protein Kapaf2KO_03700 [Candidatus Kapaibacteriales bacterium]